MAVNLIPPDDPRVEEVDHVEYQHPAEQLVESFLVDHRADAPGRHARGVHADCYVVYHAFHSSGRRPLSQITLHVIHCTQSNAGSAPGVARYFTSPASGGSTQYVSDDFECYRCLADDEIPWGAPGANYHGLHYEQCGFVSWSKFLWSRTHRRTVLRTASKIARDCRRYGNPPRWLDAEALRRGEAGITDHRTCTAVFGGTHTDPGANYPRSLLMANVRLYYRTVHRKVRRIA